jgi:hypothetical protein
VSGLEGVRFAPPTVSNITALYERVQAEFNQRMEEESSSDIFNSSATMEELSTPETAVMPTLELEQYCNDFEMLAEYDPEAPNRPPAAVIGFEVTLTENFDSHSASEVLMRSVLSPFL